MPIVRPPMMRVEQIRGGVVESSHTVHAAVVDREGRLVARAGDPDLVTFWRSAAKPFQAVPLVTDGVVERFKISTAELALCCASHSSEPEQVVLVRDLLAKIGCSERDLLCGAHPPLSEAVAKDYQTRGVRLTAVYSNCSGKHTGMLALARHHGWPTEFYTRPEHRVQQRCLEEVARWTDVPAQRLGTATDGCGVVCYALPIRNMAWAYARLGNAEWGMRNAESQGEVELRVTLPRDSAFRIRHSALESFRTPHSALRIVEAMLRHPDLIAGEGRPCTELMRAHPGRVLAKVGAEGGYSALLMPEGLGVTLKVEDGNSPAAALAIVAVLVELGVQPQPGALRGRGHVNSRGDKGGELRGNGGVGK